jgi:hypothetical protein
MMVRVNLKKWRVMWKIFRTVGLKRLLIAELKRSLMTELKKSLTTELRR